jgi:hypothetical protein
LIGGIITEIRSFFEPQRTQRTQREEEREEREEGEEMGVRI